MNTNEPARDLAGGSVDSIIDAHIAQTLNYLKATCLHLAIILNFREKNLNIKELLNSCSR